MQGDFLDQGENVRAIEKEFIRSCNEYALAFEVVAEVADDHWIFTQIVGEGAKRRGFETGFGEASSHSFREACLGLV